MMRPRAADRAVCKAMDLAAGEARGTMGILRRMFGPSKDEIWQQLAAEIGAHTTGGTFWSGTKVHARVKDWTVTLDSYVVPVGKAILVFTRLRAPYVNADGLRFAIYRRGWFSDVAAWLGAQDVEVGYPAFDRDFVIKSNNPPQARLLFQQPRLRELIETQRDIHLEVKDDDGWFGTESPEGTDELCFHVIGQIKDIERLKQLFELFSVALHELCRIGSAYEDDPKVTVE
jgi:hypothetical protein